MVPQWCIGIKSWKIPAFPTQELVSTGGTGSLPKGFGWLLWEGLVTVNIQPLTTPKVNTDADNYCDDQNETHHQFHLRETSDMNGTRAFHPMAYWLVIQPVLKLIFSPASGTQLLCNCAQSSCTSNPSPTKRLTIYKKPVVTLLSALKMFMKEEPFSWDTTTTGQGYQYSWTGPDGFVSNLANPTNITNVQTSKQGKYQLVINVENYSSDTATTNVVVLPTPPTPEITGESIYCEGSTFSLVVNNLDHCRKYTWYKDGVKFRVTNDNSLEILNVSNSATGLWQVIVESSGCPSDTSAG